MSRWLEQTRDLGVAEADAAFPAERLAAQQSSIMRKLEAADRPTRLLSFPRVTAVAPAASEKEMSHGHRVSSRWIAAAAAAGLVLGVIGGRMSVWPTTQPSRTAATPPAVVTKAPDSARAQDVDLLLLDSDISQPQIRSLSAIDSLTPQVTVARTAEQRR